MLILAKAEGYFANLQGISRSGHDHTVAARESGATDLAGTDMESALAQRARG
jgi:hypothetical protein